MIEKAMARKEVRILKAWMPMKCVILAYDWLIEMESSLQKWPRNPISVRGFDWQVWGWLMDLLIAFASQYEWVYRRDMHINSSLASVWVHIHTQLLTDTHLACGSSDSCTLSAPGRSRSAICRRSRCRCRIRGSLALTTHDSFPMAAAGMTANGMMGEEISSERCIFYIFNPKWSKIHPDMWDYLELCVK